MRERACLDEGRPWEGRRREPTASEAQHQHPIAGRPGHPRCTHRCRLPGCALAVRGGTPALTWYTWNAFAALPRRNTDGIQTLISARFDLIREKINMDCFNLAKKQRKGGWGGDYVLLEEALCTSD